MSKQAIFFLMILISTDSKLPNQIKNEFSNVKKKGITMHFSNPTLPLQSVLCKENNTKCPVSNHPEPPKRSTTPSEPSTNHNRLPVKLSVDIDVGYSAQRHRKAAVQKKKKKKS